MTRDPLCDQDGVEGPFERRLAQAIRDDDRARTEVQGTLFDPGPQETARERICKLARCGKPLSGRQRDFCSRTCCSAWWDEKHPRMGRPVPTPAERRLPLRDRILALLMDGQPRTVHEIAEALGVLDETAGAKMRDLRKSQFGGFRIEGCTGGRAYAPRAREFRLVKP